MWPCAHLLAAGLVLPFVQQRSDTLTQMMRCDCANWSDNESSLNKVRLSKLEPRETSIRKRQQRSTLSALGKPQAR